jgi:hypothetical protein
MRPFDEQIGTKPRNTQPFPTCRQRFKCARWNVMQTRTLEQRGSAAGRKFLGSVETDNWLFFSIWEQRLKDMAAGGIDLAYNQYHKMLQFVIVSACGQLLGDALPRSAMWCACGVQQKAEDSLRRRW